MPRVNRLMNRRWTTRDEARECMRGARLTALIAICSADARVDRSQAAAISKPTTSCHELDPSLHIHSRGLRRRCVVDRIVIELDRFDGVVARLARELVARCADLNRQITSLERDCGLWSGR